MKIRISVTAITKIQNEDVVTKGGMEPPQKRTASEEAARGQNSAQHNAPKDAP